MLLLALFACHPKPQTDPVCDGSGLRAEDGSVQECAGDEVCVDGAGCAACVPSITPGLAGAAGAAGAGEAIVLETAPTGSSPGILRSRPVTITTPDNIGGATLSFDGPAEALDAAGVVITEVATLPATVYLRATGVGEATLTVAFVGGELPCGSDATLTLHAVAAAPLSGRPRDHAPGWESSDSFMDIDPVYVALDPVRFSDRVGMDYAVHVVAHKSVDEWLADPTLLDVTGVVEEGTLAAGALNITEAWPEPALLDGGHGDGASARYDIVVDFGGDGTLDPGDLVDGPGEDFGFSRIGDLSMYGPHRAVQDDISGGTYLGERVYWPADIATMGARPLVVISHGNGHQHTWYDYIGEHLASWGFVVMSHENHTEPGIQTASTTTLENTDYLLSNLDTVLDGQLAGLVDGTRIGWIGHSRGGEGVIRAIDRLYDDEYVAAAFTLEDVRMLVAIAPTVFNEVNKSDPHELPLLLLAGTADGDVNGGVDCDECDFFRLWEADSGPKAATYIHGADHNDFNCCGIDDAVGPDPIGREEAQIIARGYLLAMAMIWLDDDPTVLDVFRRAHSGFLPTGHADGVVVATTYRSAEGSIAVLDDFQAEDDPAIASSGGAVTASVEDVCEDQLNDADNTETWSEDDPDGMNGMTHAATYADRAAGTTFSWSETTADPAWQVAIMPELQDASRYAVLSLSFAQVPRAPNTVALAAPLTFGVVLTDADGVEAVVEIGDRGSAPVPYQRTGTGDGAGWAAEFVTVRLPLADFTLGSKLDLSRLSSLRLVFGADHGASIGSIALDNVEFSP